ncbi:MAG: tyrosine-type recombinase/integrase [Defluviicoccus sp.]|jgi:site-specific recombinase XerD|nr:tyrosine-type recombinase/integrase [Defluviicoccus sp.]
MTNLATFLSSFLREHLPRERNASQNTCETYAYSFRILVVFVAQRLRLKPSQLTIEHVDATTVAAFLEHIERERKCCARTRNARLAAIKSFFRYLEYRLPAILDQSRQIHAIPMKKVDEALIAYLSREEIQALLDAPNPRTASGLRDRAILHLAYAAGLRVSEVVGLRISQFDPRPPSTIHVLGKGRRERVLPLWKETVSALKAWLSVRPGNGDPELFLNAAGRAMTRAGFEYILTKHADTAAAKSPSIATKRVSPHVLRHSCAMHTLQATGDVRKVSLWLGHATMQTTEVYLRADPTQKLEVLSNLMPLNLKRGRFRPPDKLLAMLTDRHAAKNYAE